LGCVTNPKQAEQMIMEQDTMNSLEQGNSIN